jgi:hypothetical protein
MTNNMTEPWCWLNPYGCDVSCRADTCRNNGDKCNHKCGYDSCYMSLTALAGDVRERDGMSIDME